MSLCQPTQSPASFETEALQWIDHVRRFARALTRGDASEADDLVQVTFLRALRSWHTYRPDTHCRAWLFTICRNSYLLERGRRSALCVSSAEEVQPEGGATFDASSHGEHDALVLRISAGPSIMHAIETLPEPFRAVAILVDVNDRTYEEAARELGVPVGTVRSRLFRARKLLQQRLRAHAEDAGIISPRSVGRTRASHLDERSIRRAS